MNMLLVAVTQQNAISCFLYGNAKLLVPGLFIIEGVWNNVIAIVDGMAAAHVSHRSQYLGMNQK